ncbi:MAG: hypothetical protein FWG18_01030 [Alphaproteobacteria bacterium]|nr:hypothetical protein [Alphaproteobacteria bacterium]
MKKQLSLFVWATAAFGIGAVLSGAAYANTTIRNNIGFAETGFHGASVADMTSGPARPARVSAQPSPTYNVGTTGPQPAPATIGVAEGPEMFYQVPSRRGSDGFYDNFDGCGEFVCPEPVVAPVVAAPPVRAAQPVRVAQPAPAPKPVPVSRRAETAQKVSDRKYHLANPFFQPEQGKFGILADIGYAKNTYDFAFENVVPAQPDFVDQTGTWIAEEIYGKLDLSFGITDTLTIIGSGRYGDRTYKMNWDDPTVPNDKNTDSGFDQWGVGLQWRFFENSDWIAYIAGYYQWTEIANGLLADAKVGYKIGNSTVYGLARFWYIMWDDNSYGNGITDDTGQSLFFAFKRGIDSSTYIEGGLGLFSALNEDWSINVEATFGDYDWHQQAGLAAGIYYQPNHWFAIGLHGRASVWDSANGKRVEAWGLAPGIPATYIGQVKLDSYQDYLVGVKLFFYF